ncbi:hypothetical protein PG994_013515 [Apiospora phragmitis]|uniref:F-box domain-containing protein n=1 Tax=Apiospora phragmitis TaxID=2905665 RepID=A0ABR1T8V5_9PEZI
MENNRAPKRTKKQEVPQSYLCRSDGEIMSDTNRLTFIGKLPTEVLIEIAELAPLNATVCLTLTCKLVLAALGTQWWTKHSDLTKENGRRVWSSISAEPMLSSAGRMPLLRLLYRDMGNSHYELCESCVSLHAPPDPPAWHTPTELSKTCQGGYINYLPGYNLLLAHLATAFERKASIPEVSTVYLAGRQDTFTTTASWIDGNLILRHGFLVSTYPTDLPIRLCPHHTTATDIVTKIQGCPHKRRQPLLLYSILRAIWSPNNAVAWPSGRIFHPSRSVEREQPTEVARDGSVLYKCEGCPTKWRVTHNKTGGCHASNFTLTAFHCFGKDLNTASRYFAWFNLRHGWELGMDRRFVLRYGWELGVDGRFVLRQGWELGVDGTNEECPERSFADFQVE